MTDNRVRVVAYVNPPTAEKIEKRLADENRGRRKMGKSAFIEYILEKGLSDQTDAFQNLIENQEQSFRKDREQTEQLIDEADRIFRSYSNILYQFHDTDIFSNMGVLMNELARKNVLERLTKIFATVLNMKFAQDAMAKDMYGNDTDRHNSFLEKIRHDEEDYYRRNNIWGECAECKKSEYWLSVSKNRWSCLNCNPPPDENDIAKVTENGEITFHKEPESDPEELKKEFEKKLNEVTKHYTGQIKDHTIEIQSLKNEIIGLGDKLAAAGRP